MLLRIFGHQQNKRAKIISILDKHIQSRHDYNLLEESLFANIHPSLVKSLFTTLKCHFSMLTMDFRKLV